MNNKDKELITISNSKLEIYENGGKKELKKLGIEIIPKFSYYSKHLRMYLIFRRIKDNICGKVYCIHTVLYKESIENIPEQIKSREKENTISSEFLNRKYLPNNKTRRFAFRSFIESIIDYFPNSISEEMIGKMLYHASISILNGLGYFRKPNKIDFYFDELRGYLYTIYLELSPRVSQSYIYFSQIVDKNTKNYSKVNFEEYYEKKIKPLNPKIISFNKIIKTSTRMYELFNFKIIKDNDKFRFSVKVLKKKASEEKEENIKKIGEYEISFSQLFKIVVRLRYNWLIPNSFFKNKAKINQIFFKNRIFKINFEKFTRIIGEHR